MEGVVGRREEEGREREGDGGGRRMGVEWGGEGEEDDGCWKEEEDETPKLGNLGSEAGWTVVTRKSRDQTN